MRRRGDLMMGSNRLFLSLFFPDGVGNAFNIVHRMPRVPAYVRRPCPHTQARKRSRAIGDRSFRCTIVYPAKFKHLRKSYFSRSKVLTPTALARPSDLTTGRVQPVSIHGTFPSTPTVPANPPIPPIPPIADWHPPPKGSNPSNCVYFSHGFPPPAAAGEHPGVLHPLYHDLYRVRPLF